MTVSLAVLTDENTASPNASLLHVTVADYVAVVYDDKWFPGMACYFWFITLFVSMYKFQYLFGSSYVVVYNNETRI